jgi:hypothetical protein
MAEEQPEHVLRKCPADRLLERMIGLQQGTDELQIKDSRGLQVLFDRVKEVCRWSPVQSWKRVALLEEL